MRGRTVLSGMPARPPPFLSVVPPSMVGGSPPAARPPSTGAGPPRGHQWCLVRFFERVFGTARPRRVPGRTTRQPVAEGNHPVADRLVVRGAREHNLRGVDLDLPRDALIVFTGLSGSGKSSLAFDTIFAEGQRRYVESLSAYARQFLGQMDKPDVDFIEGLSPAVS